MQSLELVWQQVETESLNRPLIDAVDCWVLVLKWVTLQDCVVREKNEATDEMARERKLQEIHHLHNDALVVVSRCLIKSQQQSLVYPVYHKEIEDANRV